MPVQWQHCTQICSIGFRVTAAAKDTPAYGGVLPGITPPLLFCLDAADELRLAVRDALCRSEKRKKEFKDAVFSLEATEGPIGRCFSLCVKHMLVPNTVQTCASTRLFNLAI